MDLLVILTWARHHSIVLMLAAFLLILVTTYWPGRRQSIERNASIPLMDDR